jgi:hypothetical protein
VVRAGTSVAVVCGQTPGAANAVKQFGKHLSIDATFDCVETIEHQPADQLFTLHVVDTANHAVPVCSFFGDDKKALVSCSRFKLVPLWSCMGSHRLPVLGPPQTIEAALRIFNKYATEVLGRQYRPEVVMMVRGAVCVVGPCLSRFALAVRSVLACVVAPFLHRRTTLARSSGLLYKCGRVVGVLCVAGMCFATWRRATTC